MRTVFGHPALLLTGMVYMGTALAQVPVDDAGSPYAASVAGASIEQFGEDDIPLLGSRDLETLVGPVALYPDTLLAVVLPAAAYPLQIVQAARFLDELEADPTLAPSPDWDESVIALLNYPEVLRQLNDDIDWTLELGEAVIAQQADVLASIQRFRDRAYVAGNLRSDDRQRVTRDDSVIEIDPVDESVIHVPVYRPERVVVATASPVYSYRPDPYPVYYYPYPETHAFSSGFFWGVTTAYSLRWHSPRIHVLHHSYPAHPYYRHSYGWRWWYRRPSVAYHNYTYQRPDYRAPTRVRNRSGDYWVPRQVRRTNTRSSRVPAELRRAETYTTDRAGRSSRSLAPAIGSRRSAPTPARATVRSAAPEIDRVRQRPTGASSRRPTLTDRRRPERDAYVPSQRREPTRDYRPRTGSRDVERASRYRRSEPSRQVAPKPVSRPAPARPQTRSPSVSSGSRSVTRDAPRRGGRDKARHRLRRD